MVTLPTQADIDASQQSNHASADAQATAASQLLLASSGASALLATCVENGQAKDQQIAQLNQQHAADQLTIAKLEAQQPPAPSGTPATIVTDANNGLKIKGDGLTFTGTVTNGNGQNGIGGAVTNTTINSATSNGNNTAGHDTYTEGGGGKWVPPVGHTGPMNLTLNDYSAKDNNGVALWIDSGCNGVKINRANLSNSVSTGPNAGKQADLLRVEISKNVNIDTSNFVCAPGQNTAVHFHSAQLSSLTNSTVHGQTGITADSRQPISDITIKGNQLFGAIYDSGANVVNGVIEGNTYTVPKGHQIGYLKGKQQFTIADMQAVGYEKTGTGKVVNT